ncbi:hypothetical protein WOLCODRAFT_126852 [Wolfiporia cocos MD-104 SS10]|uniref:Uncharacterized protein n=1 Tax=Wolfiporia cocos (strain MD-104) TaxID=742152 RepID=A0A2H3J2K4_WOLCO|nr:hypothetical protein WOLCODRAFT_126852 [Wolfiporia cocos MD-104 SS10]
MAGIVRTDSPIVSRRSGPALLDSSSSATIDLQEILASDSSPNLISLCPVLPSVSDDSLSFEEVPPFPADSKPGLYLTVFESPTLNSAAQRTLAYDSEVKTTVTIPTRPRLRVMLMEPIRVRQWAGNVSSSPPDLVPWQEGNLEDDTSRCFPVPPWTACGSQYPPELFQALYNSRRPGRIVPLVACARYKSPLSPTDNPWYKGLRNVAIDEEPGVPSNNSRSMEFAEKPLVPTIMVSSSTAILPISLESSQSLTRVPLAIRRGKKMPTPLTVDKPKEVVSASSYPDIPTPFLGSPSSSSPTFEYSQNPSAFSMGLEAMCNNLRSLCPDLRASRSGSSDTAGIQDQSNSCWRSLPSAQYSGSPSEDEWGFAKDLMDQYGDDKPPILEEPSTAQPVPATPQAGPVEPSGADADSFSWAMSPTLTNSIEQSATSPSIDDLKLLRRKTVIIETPTQQREPSSDSPDGGDLDDHAPIPFESPSDRPFSCSQCLQSTPPQSRPSSSASMRPVKGILKEKKSVRFSVIPSRHEYPSESHQDECAHQSLSEPARASMFSSPRSSPLRQAHSPKTPDSPGDLTAVETGPPSLPKHPALRAMARKPGRPVSPQTPTPTILLDQQRAPLRSLNARQSLPAKRNSKAVYAESARSRKSLEAGMPRRLMKAASASAVGMDAQQGPIGNVRRESVAQKSRMPVPFRTILTRFRA